MSTQFKPTQNFVVLRPVAHTDVSAGGIHLPTGTQDTTKDNWDAEVISVGPGKVNERGHRIIPAVEAGMKVLVSKYGQRTIEIEGEKLIMVPETEILGVWA